MVVMLKQWFERYSGLVFSRVPFFALIIMAGSLQHTQAQDPDLLLFIRRQEAIMMRTRVELAETGWRRFVPSVRFNMAFSNRSLLFSPVIDPNDSAANGSTPNASLWQPSDSWTLALSWRLDDLINPLPRRRAQADVRIAEANMEWAVHQRNQARQAESLRRSREQEHQHLQMEQMALLLNLLEEKRAIQQDLLALAELKYEQGELSFEGLAASRLAMLELGRQIAVARYSLRASELEQSLHTPGENP